MKVPVPVLYFLKTFGYCLHSLNGEICHNKKRIESTVFILQLVLLWKTMPQEDKLLWKTMLQDQFLLLSKNFGSKIIFLLAVDPL